MSMVASLNTHYVEDTDDVQSVYAFEGTIYDTNETDEIKSVYAFDCQEKASDKDTETDDAESVTSGSRTAAAVYEQAQESSFDRTVQWVNSLTVLEPDADASEADETKGDIPSVDNIDNAEDHSFEDETDEVSSVYAFDARNSDKVPLSTANEGLSVYAFDTRDTNEVSSPDVDEDTDEVVSSYAYDARGTDKVPSSDANEIVSVYAFEALDCDEFQSSDTTEEIVISKSASTKAIQPKSSCSFGFRFQNLGYGAEPSRMYAYQAECEDGRFEFFRDFTCFRTKNNEVIVLNFDGQDLLAVFCNGKFYKSFDDMPAEVADIFVAAHVGIVNLLC